MRAIPILLLLGMPPWLSQSHDTTAYRAAIARYRAGETEAAIETIIALGTAGLRDAEFALELAERQNLLLDAGAAAMLHTDTAEALTNINRRLAHRHIGAAKAWVDAGNGLSPPFRGRWHLAAGLLLVEQGALDGNVDLAAAHFERACRELPNDIPLLTATAWLEERRALAPVDWNHTRHRNAAYHERVKRQHLIRAGDRLRAALEREPLAVEPALRLARVTMLRSELAAARRTLEPLLTREGLSDRAGYVACILLARIMEEEKRTERAMELYREAIGRVPSAASARMGLARLLYSSNDPRAAREVLGPALSDSAGASLVDPWVEYLSGKVEHGRSLRRLLRAEVQR